MKIVIHLRILASGGFHPAAQVQKILCSQGGVDAYDTPDVLISGSRLVLVMDPGAVVIWDWKSAQILFLCQLFDP